MCHFISWIENNGEIQFLTANDVFNTKRGRELQKYCGDDIDYVGHGFIEFFTETSGGIHKECTDFSTPKNFPEVIVAAIKAGAFAGLGTPEGLLNKNAQTEYEKVYDAARTEYEKACNATWAEYNKVCKATWAECYKVCDAAYAEYNKVRNEVFWKLFSDTKNRAETWK